MAGFSTASFKSKLEKLSESQQSIQTLSHWVQYHKKSVQESAAVWAKEVLGGTPERRLLYIYLANDIMQNSRRKGNAFVEAFGAQLPVVMPATYAACPDRTREKLLRLLSIWEERRVVPGNLLAELRNSMKAAAGRGGAVADGAEGEQQQQQPHHERTEDNGEDGGQYGLGLTHEGSAAEAAGASPRSCSISPRSCSLSPRSLGTSPRAAAGAAGGGTAGGAAGAVGAERVTLAALLTSLEEGRLVEAVAAEREVSSK